MPIPVVTGATIACTMGLAPGQLIATTQAAVTVAGLPVATIPDVTPMTNLVPCGMCTSMANPQVASATAAAWGVLTPMPCVPTPAGVWVCSSTKLAGGIPVLDNTATLMCSYGGAISIVSPGQGTVLF